MSEPCKRKVRSIVSEADYAELERHHRFVPDDKEEADPSTWQERMVARYHQHLIKDCVLADFTMAHKGKLGLRWRTETEARMGKGSLSCGNKHCKSHYYNQATPIIDLADSEAAVEEAYVRSEEPDSERQEAELLKTLPCGAVQREFEVPFTYVEDGSQKTELVKLRLCAPCSPMLFVSKGESAPSLAARRARQGKKKQRTKEREPKRRKKIDRT
jgi:protein FRA10AC1